MDVGRVKLPNTLIYFLPKRESQRPFFLLLSEAMIIQTIIRGGKYSPVNKSILYLTLIGMGLIEFLLIDWIYRKMKFGMGVEVAQISLTFAMVIFLGTVLAGLGLAYFIDSALRKRRFIFRTPQPGGLVDALVKVWGFELIDEKPENPPLSAPVPTLQVDEALAIVNKPRRRGRKPTYSIDRWRRIVLKWEDRDTLRDTMTLADLLAEEFGTHADGSPRITEQSYYAWRDKVFAEIRNEAEVIKSSCKIPRSEI